MFQHPNSLLDYISNDLSIIGFSAAIDFNYVKHARYPLQVSTFVVFIKLKEAAPPSNSDLSVLEWLEVRATESEMSFF
jgi:hypothetical protein